MNRDNDNPTVWMAAILVIILSFGTLAYLGFRWLDATEPVALPQAPYDQPVFDQCHRRTVFNDCLNNNPNAIQACAHEADRQSWRPESRVPAPCRSSGS